MSLHILVVDDEADLELLIRQKFRQQIREDEWRFEFAYNGVEALRKLNEHDDIGLIFTDLNMPEMDGLTFLRELKKFQDRYTRAVVISAYGDMPNIREAMNYGAFDFITKPIDFGDFETTLNKAAHDLELLVSGQKAREALQQTILEKEKAEESKKLQKRFFDNITHELRTPLTLILGPLDEVIPAVKANEAVRKLEVAKRNAKLLYNLINQLLDFSKLEAGRLGLSVVKGNIVEFVDGIIESFRTVAEKKGLEMNFGFNESVIEMEYDRDKMSKVMYNLLSNAVKFTESGSITVRLTLKEDAEEGNQVIFSVRDTGKGIPGDKIPFVFDRFFQLTDNSETKTPGTGIGLALTRELVELHGGNIAVNSIEGMGTEFSFSLPVEAPEDAERLGEPVITDNVPFMVQTEAGPENDMDREDEDDEEVDEDNFLVLVIEDNPDVRSYIREALTPGFRVIEAPDGEEGVETAKREVPDLIISDVMMPGMDGFEVSRIIKENRSTSHIPIILLTARTDTDSKLEGLMTGADLYLSKPFNTRELEAQIKNLISIRQKLKESFKTEFLTHPGEVKAQSMEEEFLLNVRNSVEENLDNEAFSVEDLARNVGMSRTQLHRKISALTGASAGSFIRNFRLETAMGLLKKNAGNVAEIAYQVGFSSPSYFTKCFSDHFGMSPKEVKKESRSK